MDILLLGALSVRDVIIARVSIRATIVTNQNFAFSVAVLILPLIRDVPAINLSRKLGRLYIRIMSVLEKPRNWF